MVRVTLHHFLPEMRLRLRSESIKLNINEIQIKEALMIRFSLEKEE